MPYCDGNLEAIAFKQVFIYHENKCKLNFNEYIHCIIKVSSIILRYFSLSNHTTIAVLFISHIMTENQSCLMYLNMHITGKCNNEFVHRKWYEQSPLNIHCRSHFFESRQTQHWKRGNCIIRRMAKQIVHNVLLQCNHILLQDVYLQCI